MEAKPEGNIDTVLTTLLANLASKVEGLSNDLTGKVEGLSVKLKLEKDEMASELTKLRDEMNITLRKADSPLANLRRQSVTVQPIDDSGGGNDPPDRQPSVPASVIQVQRRVDQSSLIEMITLAALQFGFDLKMFFEQQNDQKKKLIYFFHVVKVLKKLVEDQRRRGTPLSQILTYENIYDLSDNNFIEIFVEYIRCNQAITRDAVLRVVLDIVPVLVPVDPSWTWQISNYDLQMHPQLHKHLDHFGKGIRRLYFGATETDTKLWPKMNWGSQQAFGMIQLASLNLGDFKENFDALIGIDRLKELTSMNDYLEELGAHNDRLADQAIEFRRVEAAGTPNRHIREVAEDMRRRRYTRIAQRPSQSVPNNVTRQNATGYQSSPESRPTTPANPSRSVSDSRYRSGDHHPNSGSQDRFRGSASDYGVSRPNSGSDIRYRGARDSYGRQSSIEEEDDFSQEASFYSESPYPSDPRQVAPDPSDFEEQSPDVSRDGEMYETLAGIYPGSGSRPSPGPKGLVDVSAKKVVNTKKPCFTHFYTRDCDGKTCGGYSHSAEEMYKLRDHLFSKLAGSPFVSKEWLAAESSKLRAYSARDASLSFMMEPQATTVSHTDFGFSNPNSGQSADFGVSSPKVGDTTTTAQPSTSGVSQSSS